MDKIITIVSGLPRSGTSMMMKILQAGGMNIITDNIRKADEDNPQGYFELEKVKNDEFNWLDDAQGKAFKMISKLLYRLPVSNKYKIIFLERNINEVLSSQKQMLIRHGSNIDENDEELKEIFNKHLNEVKAWFKNQNNIEVININYSDVVENPEDNVCRIKHFLGLQLDSNKMIKAVDKSLYRQKTLN